MSNYFKSRGIKISVSTLENYFWLIKNSFLFFDVLIFSYKIKDQLQAPRKIYCIDNGLVNLVGFKLGKDLGKVYENTVFLKLKMESINNPFVKIYYWKNPQQEEVDFVIKNKNKIKQIIQVCYEINSDTKSRELRVLEKASKELKCNNILIITENYEGEEKYNNKTIKFIPLWKWLLS